MFKLSFIEIYKKTDILLLLYIVPLILIFGVYLNQGRENCDQCRVKMIAKKIEIYTEVLKFLLRLEMKIKKLFILSQDIQI